MVAKIIDGKAIASELKARIKQQIADNHQLSTPGLAVILVGKDPASCVYVRHKKQACEQVGMRSFVHHMAEDVSQAKLIELVNTLNHDDRVNGILVQLPLPKHINLDSVIDTLNPAKDVDGLHPENMGRLMLGRPIYRPCTPQGIIALLQSTQCKLATMNAVILGRSHIVGRPLFLELLAQNCTPTICHRQTTDLAKQVRAADIVIAAMGCARLIPDQWIKPGAIVIDVGINRLDNGTLVGDVDYDRVRQVASHITPVPGGVGPMTIACLLNNTLISAQSRSFCT